jgi:4-hydroxy-3-methylbut-2-enyl diphosphate reductase
MEIIRAPRFSGFCGGVKRAWTIALRTRDCTEGPVYLSGELINNDPAMRELEERGLQTLRVIEGEVPNEPGTLVMRAHGESPVTFERAQALGLDVVDATCGIVLAVQKKARQLEEDGFQVILYGHRSHPEAKATVAHTQHGLIVESVEEARSLPRYERIAALAQTTMLLSDYDQVCQVLQTKTDDFVNQGQICAWTRMAQDEAASIAPRCDVMLVVGGRKSANSRQLVEVCKRYGPAYLVETEDEVEPEWFAADSVVGVTAGASTRETDVQAVIGRVEHIGNDLARQVPA